MKYSRKIVREREVHTHTASLIQARLGCDTPIYKGKPSQTLGVLG